MSAPSIEVIIWDPAGFFSSSMGHVSVVITRDGKDTSYSLAPRGCDIEQSDDYLAKNMAFRSGYGLILALEPDKADAVAKFFETTDWCNYGLINHNCTAPIQDALKSVGVKLDGKSVFPKALGLNLWRNGLVKGVRRYEGPHNRFFVAPWSNTLPGAYPWERAGSSGW